MNPPVSPPMANRTFSNGADLDAMVLLADLRARGLAVWADGDTVCIEPATALTASDLVWLRDVRPSLKPGLLRLLAAHPGTPEGCAA